MSYRNSPKYQRKIQQLRADPKRAHLVRSFMTEAAGQDMDRQIALAKLGFEKERGEKSLAFREKKLGVMEDIERSGIESREKTSLLSDASREKRTLADIASREKIRGGILGLKEQAFEDEKSQMPWEIGIAAAGIPLEYALGRREAKEKKANRALRELGLNRGRSPWMDQ